MATKTAAKTRYLTKLEQIEQLSEQEKTELKKVADRFLFAVMTTTCR